MTAILLDRQVQEAETAAAFDDLHDDDSTSFFMPAGAMTLAHFRRWTHSPTFPKTGVISYFGKEVFIDMSPERLKSHGSVKTAVSGTVIPLVLQRKKGKIYFDLSRLVNKDADISNEPDALFASWEAFKTGRIRMIPSSDGEDYIELEGSPDWILEVVSPSSAIKDKLKLRGRYHLAGIREYWLIDARSEVVEFQILVHGDDDYVPAKRVGEWQVSPVFGKKFRLRRIEDELGDVDFRLDVK